MTEAKRRQAIDVSELDSELLEELERQSLREIRKVRRHERVQVKLELRVQMASSSEVNRFDSSGFTKDLSAGGCRCIIPRAPWVGDVYRIQIHDKEHSLPLVFARCLRCQFVREDAFDCSFLFFTPLEAPEIFGDGWDKDLLD